MIVTTTPFVEGHPVDQYLRVVSGETVAIINTFQDLAAGFRNLADGRSEIHEQGMLNARETALAEMVNRAQHLGAQGIVGVTVDYMSLAQGRMVAVTASGTAVTFGS